MFLDIRNCIQVVMADIVLAECEVEGEQNRKSSCRDPFFAALFLVNVGVVLYFAISYGATVLLTFVFV